MSPCCFTHLFPYMYLLNGAEALAPELPEALELMGILWTGDFVN